MLWMIFLSIENCQSPVYALNDCSIERKMSVSCVCLEWFVLSIEKLSVSCVCFEWNFYRWKMCQSRVYALNVFSIDRKCESRVYDLNDFSIDRKNVSLVCMIWMIFLSIEKCQTRMCLLSIEQCESRVICSIDKKCYFRVYALNGFSINGNMSVSCVCFGWLFYR